MLPDRSSTRIHHRLVAICLIIGLVVTCPTLSAQLRRSGAAADSKPIDLSVDADKLPVPAAKELEAAAKLVRDLFKAEVGKAKKAEQKSSLAQKLLREARQVEDDPASYYVLLREAAELATMAGDAATMRGAFDEMGRTFRVEDLGLKADSLKRMGMAAKTPDAARSLVPHCMDIADEILVLDRYDIANELGDLAVQLASRSKTPALQKSVKPWRERLTQASAKWNAAEEARAKLKEDPDDSAAHGILGRYLCFVTRDWKQGLPHLAKAGDDDLQKAAELDLDAPSDPEKMALVGDAWADLAKGTKGEDKRAYQIRALDWFRRSVLKLAGATRTRVEKRIQELDRALGPN
jgi:hypothetical protein